MVQAKWRISKRQSVLKRDWVQHANLEMVNELLTYAIMFHSLILAYVQFVIGLIVLKRVLSAGSSNATKAIFYYCCASQSEGSDLNYFLPKEAVR
jgi:hypothetical protein